MKRRAIQLLTIALVCLPVSKALAIGGDHSAGKPTEGYRDDWPSGLADLATASARIQGHWVNANDFFYFQGNASDFNEFISQYALLPEIDPTVFLHAGQIPLTGPLGKEQTTPYRWKMEVYRRGEGAPIDPRRAKGQPGYRVTVRVWLSDEITLDELKIPKHVDVHSAGDIDEFIERHRNN